MLFKNQKLFFLLTVFFVWGLFLNFFSYDDNFAQLSATSANSTLILSITGEGEGKIAASNAEDVFCQGSACFFSLPFGSQFTFKPLPNFDSTFEEWRAPESCVGKEECSVLLNVSHLSVWARFGKYPVKAGDEACAAIKGRCIDVETEIPYGPCDVNGQVGIIAWNSCRHNPALCGQPDSNTNLCTAEDSPLYRCCVQIDEEKNEGCAAKGGECIWLDIAAPRTEGSSCMLGGESGKISAGLCQADPNDYYACCVLQMEVEFTATEEDIELGEDTTLEWSSEGFESCEGTDGTPEWRGNKNLNGQQKVTPVETTTYSLVCKKGEKEISKSVTINVEETELSLEFTANPESIDFGGFSSLRWTTEGAESCSASEGWSGSKSVNGTERVTPEETTTYSLTCENETNEVTESVTVTVAEEEEDDDPVTSDRGCAEIGGKCMWLSSKGDGGGGGDDNWWEDIFSQNSEGETCDTGCIQEGLCRAQSQDYAGGNRYVCCAPEHYCENDDATGPVSEEDKGNTFNTDGDGFVLNGDCPFIMVDEKQRTDDNCGQWCIEGPYDKNKALMERLHSSRIDEQLAEATKLDDNTKSKYGQTDATNSVVISHCHSNGFTAPADGETVSVYQIGTQQDPTELHGGIVEFKTEDEKYGYRIEPIFPLGATTRVAYTDGQVVPGQQKKGTVLAKIVYKDDNSKTAGAENLDPCNKYGMYVEVLDPSGDEWKDHEVCADCHFTNDYGCNFYSTTENEIEGTKETCGRCQRFGELPTKCKTPTVPPEDRICIPRGSYLKGCTGNCIVENNKNYCCDNQWDKCYEKSFDQVTKETVCGPVDSCIPIERVCPGDTGDAAQGVAPADPEPEPTPAPEPDEYYCCIGNTGKHEEGTILKGHELVGKSLNLKTNRGLPDKFLDNDYECDCRFARLSVNKYNKGCEPHTFGSILEGTWMKICVWKIISQYN